ncbi:unnamed protein product [Amaranthus hypochondriacus]
MAFPKQTPQNDTALSSPSPELFSFPGTPTEDQSKDPTKESGINELSSTSPADQFFLNGRLLPHDFPVQTTSSTRSSFSGRDQMTSHSHSTNTSSVTLSRGTSAGSKEYSLVSSRSNSTNSSRGSTCSSIIISVEQKKTSSSHKRMNSLRSERNNGTSPLGKYYKYGSSSGSSQRWQFITAVPPVLGPSQSRRGRKENNGVGSTTSPRMMIINNNKDGGSNNNNNNTSFLYRMLRSVVATCKACHAMEGQDKEFELDPVGEVLGH